MEQPPGDLRFEQPRCRIKKQFDWVIARLAMNIDRSGVIGRLSIIKPERISKPRIRLRQQDQLAGAASGLDLNWRAACRARSHKEFTAKLGIVLEEADEAEGCLDNDRRDNKR